MITKENIVDLLKASAINEMIYEDELMAFAAGYILELQEELEKIKDEQYRKSLEVILA